MGILDERPRIAVEVDGFARVEKHGLPGLGRLGDYKYYDMDKAIERAINLFEEIKL